MTGRELAWRVLAQELGASLEAEKGAGERAASYLISPLGARMNRVAMVGTVSAPEAPRTSVSGTFRRSRLTDPTGTVTLTAGSFQPRALDELEAISGPTRVLLVGKPTLYRGINGPPVPSVRAEAVHPVPDAEYRSLLAEAAVQTLERLRLVHHLRTPATGEGADLRAAGMSAHWIRGARATLQHYPATDEARFYEGLRAVLIALEGPEAPAAREQAPAPGPGTSMEFAVVRRTPVAPPVSHSAPPAALRSLEARLLEILDQLAEESNDGYADMDDLAERAARFGIDGDRMEEALNYLSENGTLEEPLVGKFRRAEGPPPD